MQYTPLDSRYEKMIYNRCGNSGLKLPAISLGLWHNFGHRDVFDNGRKIILEAFNLGITHFDLANNYGPPAGSAEENFGKVFREDLSAYRDELIISTKAGHPMWSGPYGDWGSRKHLISSLDQGLKRMGLEYVDIFYHHRPDPDTPLEETMSALDHIVRSGRALYIGISSYGPAETEKAAEILEQLGTPCLIHQPKYNLLDRWIENGLTDVLKEKGIGAIVFSPLEQGVLTDKYLKDIPADSRAAGESPTLQVKDLSETLIKKVDALNQIAEARNQSLAQMALAWVLRLPVVTSALIGARNIEQLKDSVDALGHLSFTDEELSEIELIIQK